MQAPLISCLCVTEGRPAFMPWLLWNYDRQTWAYREMVIVDSSVEPFQSDRADVRVVTAPAGTTVAAKRNLALDAARGDIITWFDDDDWQHPDKISLLAAALSEKDAAYAGACRGWFVELASERCARYQGTHRRVIFNSAGFCREAVLPVRFVEKLRKASDTRWMQEVGRRYPQQMAVLDREDLFFWICHTTNLSNPARRRHFTLPLATIREIVGDAWGDTDEALAALRERQAGTEARPRPSKRAASRRAAGDAAAAPLSDPPRRDQAEMPELPPVSVMIKATVLDTPYLDTMVRHMIAQARYPFAERAIIVERNLDFSGKYRGRQRGSDADLDAVLARLLADGAVDQVREVDTAPARVREVMGCYFARDAGRVPTHAVTGGPIYATLFGLESMPTDCVLQMDADLFFYTGQASWVEQALRCMARDERIWLMMAHPGPPAGPPGRSLVATNARRARWDARLSLWRFRTATTRYFLCDRRRLRGQLLPLFRAQGCLPLEQCISAALQQNGASRGNLGDGNAWHLHAWSHDDPFPQWSAALAEAVAAGRFPDLQRGQYDLRLDQHRHRQAWRTLLHPPRQANDASLPVPVVATTAPRPSTGAPSSAGVVDESREAPLAVVIPIRDRAGARLRNALHSLLWQSPGRPAQVVVVSYGSQRAINTELETLCCEMGATLLVCGEPDHPWNKSRALNIGIRATLPDVPFLMTMDADMILAPNFLETVLDRLKREPPALVLCRSADLPRNAALPEKNALLAHFNRLAAQAHLRHRGGTGGVQAASRRFFFEIRGYDEDLLWWGAMDGDMVNRARVMGLQIEWVEAHTTMLHQWHPRKHLGLTRSHEIEAAKQQWKRNHIIAQQRAALPQRNPQIWGEVVEAQVGARE